MSVSNLGDLLAKSREERTSTETLYSEILDLLTDSLKDDEAEVRAAVVEALGRYAALISGNILVDTPTKLTTKD